jgi:hypothetical protein
MSTQFKKQDDQLLKIVDIPIEYNALTLYNTLKISQEKKLNPIQNISKHPVITILILRTTTTHYHQFSNK